MISFCNFWHTQNKTFSLDYALKCQPWDNEIMHIPKLHVPNSNFFLNELAFSHRKERTTKGQMQLKSTQKKRRAFKSNVNSHDNHNIAMLFYSRKKLNANLIYCLKNNMQE